ncbi:hypothetical protein [Actinokineospora cianjurensis]|uniref:hypothetical protein n=1 Tax=Actinokineospora cianjurensis TaxID=585224 RepID=UPI0011C394BB|nr:hypothetical protein [Actinokineospora cianjurensis]
MAHTGRDGDSDCWRRKWSGPNRREPAERSKQPRNTVKNRWDEARVKEVLTHIDPGPTALISV